MSLKVVERSYCTPNGWRLATYEEAENGVESIKEQGLLGKWDRARLLDGWISGPGYNFQMRNDFRSCMGYMLIIQPQPTSGSAYVDVSLGDLGKEVALLLCAEDWNLEVIYWLFNRWSKSELMDIRDLRDGNIPDAVKFREMNVKICKLAKNFGNLVGEASEKAGKKMYYGHSSIEDVMCGISEFLKEDPDAAEFVASDCGRVFRRDSYVKYFSPLSVELSYDAWIEIAEAFWSFFSDSFACSFVKAYACNCVLDISSVNAENNFIVASKILFYLVKFQCEIIHAPLQHDGRAEECAPKIFRYLTEKASGDPKCLKEMLQDNAMWRCYTDIGNYDLLHMLLIRITEEEVRDATLVVNMLLQCGARPRPANTIGCCENKTTALHCAAGRDYNEDLGLELAKSFLQKCDEKERKELIDATDEKEMTALHRACEKGNARICGLLLDYGAALDVRDDKGMTPIHHAAMHDQVMNVFIERPYFSYCVDIQDNEGKRPIDTMFARSSEAELVAKVVSFSKQPQDYFTKLNWEHLVPQFLQKGSVDMVSKIFQAGAKLPDVYDGDKTALHFAAMCQDANDSLDMFKLILKHSPRKHDLVAKRDRKGRSALHEVALRGDYNLSYFLLQENSKIVNITDRDGRNPLYEAVKGCRDHQEFKKHVGLYLSHGMVIDDLIDRRGQTPLHVAASLGKEDMVNVLLSLSENSQKIIKRSDFLGKTALHMAASCGSSVTVRILLERGAEPLRERDCDRRTALHYAAQAVTGEEGITLAEILIEGCKSDQEKLLFLFASAAGLGTADQNLSDPVLKDYLLKQKQKIKDKVGTNNLLHTAACFGDIEMTKELLIRGCQLSDIHDQEWRKNLAPTQRKHVDQVSSQLKRFVDQGNDQPTTSDNLGRDDYARGLAALFLNPYLKSPIAVGISGSWGMGKSSLMIQTEVILLQTSVQLSLLPSSKFSNSASDIPGAKTMELSEKGKMKHREIKRQLDLLSDEQIQAKNQNEDSLDKFLDKYDVKYHDIFKSLAVMDKSDMFKQNGQPSNSKGDFPTEESVPAILTVQYNAWKYRNESEALAGMAVEITKEIEGTMTRAQWLSTCWRNTWNKKKYAIFVDIIFPCLLTIALASSITLIVWVMLDRYKLKEWAKAKYACLPAALVITGWTLTKSVMGIIKPVSSQLMNYMSFPDHADKLGYQERVISDIKFLKEEMGKQPHGAFTTFLMLWKWTTSLFTTILMLWQWITLSILNPARSKRDTRIVEVATEIAKVAPASPTSLTRIIVFVDDLDRCNESVILQVLSAINLALAVCEINVILGMDKDLIERAIIKKYGDAKGKKSSKHNKELADMYIQKIIQLPLDLADPSKEESRRFLKGQLGVFEKPNKTSETDSEIETESEKEINPSPDVTIEMQNPEEPTTQAPTKTDPAVSLVIPTFCSCWNNSGTSDEPTANTNRGTSDEPTSNTNRDSRTSRVSIPHAESESESESEKEINPGPDVTIEMQNPEEPTTQAPTKTDPAVSLVIPTFCSCWNNSGTSDEPTANTNRGIKSSVSLIPIRDILFVTYSEGEQDAFCYFQEMATECRKLPREWKRLLNYHRLVWYIFLISNQAKVLAAGWQVHLIAWIFVCWEWEDNMNFLIENWREIGLPNIDSDSGGPSLLLIVEHLMEEHDQKADHPNRKDETSEKIQEVEGSVGKTGNIKETAPSSINEAQKLKDAAADMMARIPKLEGEMATSTDGSDGKEPGDALKDKLDTFEKTLGELKKEMKELRDQVSLELKERKEHMVKKQSEKIKNKAEDKKINMENIKNWKRMKSALEKYDVPMEFIQAFQRFRFYCIAGYLPWTQGKNSYL